MEADDEVELAEVLRPSSLSVVKEFGGGKVFEVFVIRDNIDRSSGTLEVVAPNAESFEDREEFLVVDVVVELRGMPLGGFHLSRARLTG